MRHRTVPRPPVDADFVIDAATFQMEVNNQSKLLRQCKKGNAGKEKTRRLATANRSCIGMRGRPCKNLPHAEMLSRPGSPRPRPDQDQTGWDRDRYQDQGGRDQYQDPRPRPRPLLSWSRPAHTNSFHSSTFEYCTAVNVIMHKNIQIGLSNNK